MMKEYRIVWVKLPTNYNDPKVMFVLAYNEADAKTIAGDYIERKFAIPRDDFYIQVCTESQPIAKAKGHVIEKRT